MPHAVIPKTDCPHLANALQVPSAIDVRKECETCKDGSENWLCLTCHKVFCSRYVKGHAREHNSTSNHPIMASFSDFSIWCYECDSYIKHPTLVPVLDLLNESKFGDHHATVGKEEEEEEEKGGSSEDGRSYSEIVSDDETSEKSEIPIELLRQLLGATAISKEPETSCLEELTLKGVAEAIKSGKCKKIIVMTGAGISVASGIPDFRTPGTGLYDNLQKYNLPYPTAVFELDYFRTRPQPFYILAKELYPGNFKPTLAHFFIRLLHEKGLLLRNFTQNIDTLERQAGIPADVLVEAHGSFASAHCIKCRSSEESENVRKDIFDDKIPSCKQCGGLIKPDIVFFGENLPQRFFQLMASDFPGCDLLIVMGTSLQVQPFASLIHKVSSSTPRVLINNEKVGTAEPSLIQFGVKSGFLFDEKSNYRDVCEIGDLQKGTAKLVNLLGWKSDLQTLIEKELGKEVYAKDFEKYYS